MPEMNDEKENYTFIECQPKGQCHKCGKTNVEIKDGYCANC
jgi:hypothetical protein